MKTKILALLLALVMVVALLASCGGGGGGGETPPAESCPPHADGNNDNKCDKCGAKMGPTVGPVTPGGDDELPAATWDKVTLKFQMTDNSNHDELSSGCRKYLAGGEYNEEVGSIYDSVNERNEDAENYANVDVIYWFYQEVYGENTGRGWGQCITAMETAAKSSTEETRPDMFCNFVYDMVSASLLSAFQNLYSEHASEGVESGALTNYFDFATNGKYNGLKDTGEGYMIDYMQSLTLSEEKMYLLASDYFIDLVRAFFVVPVNVSLIEHITPSNVEGSYNYDYVDEYEDGETYAYTIADFYALVNDQKWTYESVIGFSGSIMSITNEEDVCDADNVWGFALAAGGLGASGILYTTSITVIQREVDDNAVIGTDEYNNPIYGQEYKFYYPNNFDVLKEFVGNLNALFSSDGVTHVSTDAKDANTTYYGTPEQAVRDRFSANSVLFGGIICVGSLEEDEYLRMTDDGGKGFGVAPVPLYRGEYYDEILGATVTDRYLTQIHNIGRVGAIALKSKYFAQCSAFLNYQSNNSTDILNDYYNWTLKGDVAGAVEGNSEMLDYIRENVRSSFDKAFEDAVARQELKGGDSSYNENKWHNMILAKNFKLTIGEMNEKYDGVVDAKSQALDELEQAYRGLPE